MNAAAAASVWPVDRYARYVAADSTSATGQQGKKAGYWQHFSSPEAAIQLSLLQANHLMISSGKQIYESFSLWEAEKWMKVISKGDSILFIHRIQDQNRRFRVRFAPSGSSTSSLDTCRSFVTLFSQRVPVREMPATASSASSGGEMIAGVSDSQVPYDECSQMSCLSQPLLPPPSTHTGHIPVPHSSSVAGTSTSRQQQHNPIPVPSSQISCAALLTSSSDPGSSRGAAAQGQIQSHSQGRGWEGLARERPPLLSGGVGNNQQSKESLDGVCGEAGGDLLTVSDIAKCLGASQSHQRRMRLGNAYTQTNFPTEQIGAFIRLCLTDSNFPGFVEEVEKELQELTRQS